MHFGIHMHEYGVGELVQLVEMAGLSVVAAHTPNVWGSSSRNLPAHALRVREWIASNDSKLLGHRGQDQMVLAVRRSDATPADVLEYPRGGSSSSSKSSSSVSQWRSVCVPPGGKVKIAGEDQEGTKIALKKSSENGGDTLACARYTIDIDNPLYFRSLAPYFDSAFAGAPAAGKEGGGAAEGESGVSRGAEGGETTAAASNSAESSFSKKISRESFDKLFAPYKEALLRSEESLDKPKSSNFDAEFVADLETRIFTAMKSVESFLGSETSRKTTTVLDVSGMGALLKQLFEAFYDPAVLTIEYLDQDFREDFETAKLKHESFDILLSIDRIEKLGDRAHLIPYPGAGASTHHFTGIHSYLLNSFSMLKEEGLFIVLTANQQSFTAIGNLVAYGSSMNNPHNHHEYTLNELRAMLSNTGFQHVHHESVNPVEVSTEFASTRGSNFNFALGGDASMRGRDMLLVSKRVGEKVPAREIGYDRTYSLWPRKCLDATLRRRLDGSSCKRYSIDVDHPIKGGTIHK